MRGTKDGVRPEGARPCAVHSRGTEGRRLLLARKGVGRNWGGGGRGVVKGFLMHRAMGGGVVGCALFSYPIASIYKGRGREEKDKDFQLH